MLAVMLNSFNEYLELKYENFTLKILGYVIGKYVHIKSFILLDNISNSFAYLIFSETMILNIDSNICIRMNRLEKKNNFLFFNEMIVSGRDTCSPFMKIFKTHQVSENYNGYLII